MEKRGSIESAMLNCGLDFLEARLLMQHALDTDHTWLSIHRQETLSGEQLHQFNILVNRHLFGEPIAYILGYREFYGLKFKVTPAVLIPRPETELVVETALSFIPEKQSYKILDLGTGSGAIAISIASQRPLAEIVATDYSLSALEIARENAKTLNTPNVKFLQSDWFSDLDNEKFDVIVSNPPYIENEDPHLTKNGLPFEPTLALVGGKDGLDALRKIISEAPSHLRSGGNFMLEHGYNQSEVCQSLLTAHGFKEINSLHDLSGIPRITIGKI